LYRIFIALALNTQFAGIEASDLNLITSLLVIFAMLIPKFRQTFQNYRQRK
jgi:putative ABC transport system permease protein